MAVAAYAVPVRLAETVPASDTTLTVPVNEPTVAGAKLTVTLQVAPCARDVPQVVAAKLRPVPVTEVADGVVILNTEIPVLVKVVVCA